MTTKLQVTAEQAKALKDFFSFFKEEPLKTFADHCSIFNDEYKPIKDLSIDQMAIALYVGYEIPQPTPQEIFWAELNRPDQIPVVGDIIETITGNCYRLVADKTVLASKHCYLNDVLSWIRDGELVAIYPIESRKEYSK